MAFETTPITFSTPDAAGLIRSESFEGKLAPAFMLKFKLLHGLRSY
jgi:hypothetical protein